jgi:hypothetical protein
MDKGEKAILLTMMVYVASWFLVFIAIPGSYLMPRGVIAGASMNEEKMLLTIVLLLTPVSLALWFLILRALVGGASHLLGQ